MLFTMLHRLHARARRRLLAFALALGALFAAALSAHELPRASLLLDLESNRVEATLTFPLDRLQRALGRPLDPDRPIEENGLALRGYLASQLHARASDGRAWTLDIHALAFTEVEQVPSLAAEISMAPPPGAPSNRFALAFDGIEEEPLMIAIRSDWRSGLREGEPELAGILRGPTRSISIDRSSGTALRGFLAALKLGMRHIAEGTDHLLFLLALLLPAPLLAANRRWGMSAGARRSLLAIAKVVTAFTIGHSLTLISGTLGWLRPPQGPIELLIAISILVSAIHALRPIFPGREPWIAAAFGLVHGLAFATVLAGMHLDGLGLAIDLSGFNLGIELMQLAIVALVIPWLIWGSLSPRYAILRIGGALFAGIAALAWIGQRAFSWPNPLDRPGFLAIAGISILLATALVARTSRLRDAS